MVKQLCGLKERVNPSETNLHRLKGLSLRKDNRCLVFSVQVPYYNPCLAIRPPNKSDKQCIGSEKQSLPIAQGFFLYP